MISRVVFLIATAVSILLVISNPVTAQTLYSLGDINTQPSGSAPSHFAVLDDALYVSAITPDHGRELWVATDPGSGNATLFVDLVPGRDDSNPSNLTVVGDHLYFTASTPETGFELWRTDGTLGQVELVADIYPGPLGFAPSNLLAFGHRLFFAALDDVAGGEPWITDGTEAGTFRLRDIYPGDLSSGIRDPVVIDGSIYFRATDPSNGAEIWRTDGTTAGTIRITDICPGSCSSNPGRIVVFGDWMYFSASDGNGTSLWRTDGVTTERFGDFPDPFELTTGGNYLWWSNNFDSVKRSDGTVAGTAILAVEAAFDLTGVTGGLLFWGQDELGDEPWYADGAGARRIVDLNPDGDSRFGNFASAGDIAYFVADDGMTGSELWSTNGTTAGTRQIVDLAAGEASSSIQNLTPIGERLFFAGDDGIHGLREPFLWDGNQVRLIADIDSVSTLSSSPADSASAGGQVFFGADDAIHGRELWASDGTRDSARLVAEMIPGPEGGNPRRLQAFGDRVLFVADDDNGLGIWISDGNATGTRRLAGITLFSEFAILGERAIFTANNQSNGFELWVTDGTVEGTQLLVDFVPGTSSSYPGGFFVDGNRVFFSVFTQSSIGTLHVTDGTAAGTRLLATNAVTWTVPSSPIANPRPRLSLARLDDGNLLFSGAEGSANALWRTDGTPQGTFPLPPNLSPSFAKVSDLRRIGDRVVFIGDDGARGDEPWVSDGTLVGTRLLADTHPGPDGSARLMTSSEDRYYFVASNPGLGREPWVTDGTPQGTQSLGDLNFGADSDPQALILFDDELFFAAEDGVSGRELWVSDGTVSGTRLFADLAAGAGSSFPLEAFAAGQGFFVRAAGTMVPDIVFTDGESIVGTVDDPSLARALGLVDNKLLFAGQDGFTGLEPWAVAAPLADADGLLPVGPGGRFEISVDWRDFDGDEGTGTAVPITDDTGAFWYFDAANFELMIKVLDGRPINGRWWVFYGSLSNVEYTITVRDLDTGAERIYFNPLGTYGSRGDTNAF
ncbi:MAG: hypothetical protein AAGD38_18490 [Acidobacteriota bacterium]